MPHDLIDNRSDKLLDYILATLPTTERARFAVGYLFLSGLKPLREQLEKLTEIRLLIGDTTNRETIETLAEGYKRLEPLAEAAEAWRYPKRAAQQQAAQATGENLAEAFALMDQSDEDEAIIHTVIRLIGERKLKVRVYIKGRLHAKAYIFDYGPVFDLLGNPLPRPEKGLAVVGSSNLTLSGIELNAELNVVVHGNANHAGLVDWFEALWDEAQDFDAALMTELRRSWAGGEAVSMVRGCGGGYMSRPRTRQTEVSADELTFARYGLWHYVRPEKQRRAPRRNRRRDRISAYCVQRRAGCIRI